MKRKLRAKIRRGRGGGGATTIQGMLQGMRQRSRSGLVKAKSVGAKIGKGSQINAVRNKVTGLGNQMRGKV